MDIRHFYIPWSVFLWGHQLFSALMILILSSFERYCLSLLLWYEVKLYVNYKINEILNLPTYPNHFYPPPPHLIYITIPEWLVLSTETCTCPLFSSVVLSVLSIHWHCPSCHTSSASLNLLIPSSSLSIILECYRKIRFYCF